MKDPLTYQQRFLLGAISVRREAADEARRNATEAGLQNDVLTSEMWHIEADRHEAAIIAAMQGLDTPLVMSSAVPALRIAS
jgi:hypothetical protein